MKKRFFTVFSSCVLFLSLYDPLSATAITPTITGVAGSIATGETLVISGSNMVDEDSTKWDSFFIKHPTASGFEGITWTADGYGTPNGIPSGQTYDTSTKLMGNKSIKFHVTGASSNCPRGNLTSYTYAGADLPAYRDMWIRFYARWNTLYNNWPSSHIKMIMDLGTPEVGLQPSAGGPLPAYMNAGYDSKAHNVSIPSGTLQNNRWYAFEIHWKMDTAPYVYEAWMDNVKIVTANPSRQCNLKTIVFGLINLCGTPSAFSLDHWWDGFAISTSRIYLASTVEISNNAVYGQGIIRYQEPQYLSDSLIQVKADLSGMGSGPYYLWITNNKQQRNALFRLSAGSGTLQIPSPPTDLTSQ